MLVVGAGHFGKRAVNLLSSQIKAPLWVVEEDEEALRLIAGPSIKRVLHEAVSFLVSSLHLFRPTNTIVPAVPVHLAFEWVCLLLKENVSVSRIRVPEKIKPLLPHPWDGTEGSLLVSYADFRCPDDCPEPDDHCTVTGERRRTPLHALLRGVSLPGYHVHVIRSRQMAPGVGGYTVGDLRELLERVKTAGESKWLVATACGCHGVVSAMEVRKGLTQNGPMP